MEKISPQQFQEAIVKSEERLKWYRRARTQFIRAYVGQYYNIQNWDAAGENPINLIFNAIRAIVPHLIMRNPKHGVYTKFGQPASGKTDELRWKLDSIAEQISLYTTLRACIVDTMFGFGIIKTGLKQSSDIITIDDFNIDPGQMFVGNVDMDNFVFDPCCTQHLFKDALFLGDRVRVPRHVLLDTKGYNKEEVRRLPNPTSSKQDTRDVSGAEKFGREFRDLRDMVDVIELWIPETNELVTVADPSQYKSNKFLRKTEYYGPKTGPYTFLCFTQPVPNNPIPVAPVSLWYDLNESLNDIFKKAVNQGLRQRDIMLYAPANAEIANDLQEAYDGEAIASTDPKAVNVISLGGANSKNNQMVGELQNWFNYMAANPDQMAGIQSDVETATQAQIMQGNASIVTDDMRDIIYTQTAEISRKIAWYVAEDPLDPTATKEDWIQFLFTIVPKSMGRISAQVRTQRMMQLMQNVVPSLTQAAMVALQMGQQFNLPAAIEAVAKELDLEDTLAGVFTDPNHMQKLATYMTLGPASPAKKGGKFSMKGVLQNGGDPNSQAQTPSPQQSFNQNAQATAGEAQQANYGVM